MQESVGKRLKQIVGLSGLNFQSFADQGQVSAHSMRGWAYGITNMTMTSAEKVVNAAAKCGVQASAVWLLDGVGAQPKLLNFDEKLPNESLVSRYLGYSHWLGTELELFNRAYQHSITFLVPDDSMHPFYHKDDYIGGIFLKPDELNQAINHVCIIRLYDDSLICRRLILAKDQTYTLHLINWDSKAEQAVIPQAKFKAVAPVTRVWYTKFMAHYFAQGPIA